MIDLKTHQRRLRLRWVVPILIFCLAVHLSTHGGILNYFFCAFGLAAITAIVAPPIVLFVFVVESLLKKRPRVRLFAERCTMAVTILLSTCLFLSLTFHHVWKTGYPGNSTYVRLSAGELEVEIDHSFNTRHAVLYHNAPGYHYFKLHFGWVLLVVGPLTVQLWTRRLYLRFPWLNQRYPDGYCPDCGYNLTGNVSDVCPECGRPLAHNSGDE